MPGLGMRGAGWVDKKKKIVFAPELPGGVPRVEKESQSLAVSKLSPKIRRLSSGRRKIRPQSQQLPNRACRLCLSKSSANIPHPPQQPHREN